jgi:hypothetical protein
VNIANALVAVRDAFQACPLGVRFYTPEGFHDIFTMDPTEGLQLAERAVREMADKRSLEEVGYWALHNELQEKILVYNLLLAATEDGEVPLTGEDIADFRRQTRDCALMTYGARVQELTAVICKGEGARLPEGPLHNRF